MPGVLLRALSEYNFVGSPLWRMSDGKDLVRVELTFHKNLYQRLESTRRGLKAGGSLHPLLASGLASPLLLEDRHAENRRRWRGRRYHHHHRLQYRRRTRSQDHATRLQLPSPHRQLSPDQHQRLPWHHLRRKPGKSLQHQTARSSTARTTTRTSTPSTRNMTYRTL